MLILALLLIAGWQASFRNQKLDPTWRLLASSGLHDEWRFVYFLRHLGLFPLASELAPTEESEAGAQRLIDQHGDRLVMEIGHTVRYGELGKIFVYLPHALVKGRSHHLSVKLTHQLAFGAALLLTFASFWWVRRPILGAFVVLLFGSNPFQLFEVYANENVFSWNITTALLVLALHIPLIFARPRRWWLLPLATGILLGTIRQIRTEPALIIASALLCALALSSWKQRLIASALLLGSFFTVSAAWSLWFDAKWDQSRAIVAEAGGHPFPGAREKHHLIWHPIWCGLGDFGEDRGYRWDDRVAAQYALPILASRYGVEVPRWDGASYVFEDVFIDPERKYYQVPYLLPHYTEVVRDKVLSDVLDSPLWYLGVLAKRAGRILTETTPMAIAFGDRALRIPAPGWLALLLAAALLALCPRRRRTLLLLLLFPLPLSTTALLIYSGRGVTYYGCFHLLPLAILAAALVEAARLGARRMKVR